MRKEFIFNNGYNDYETSRSIIFKKIKNQLTLMK